MLMLPFLDLRDQLISGKDREDQYEHKLCNYWFDKSNISWTLFPCSPFSTNRGLLFYEIRKNTLLFAINS